MPYQNSQPLGSSARGGGGGWKFLNMMNGGGTSAPTDTQSSALASGAGPVTQQAALNYFQQQAAFQSALGMGSNTVSGALTASSDLGFKNAYAGYTGKPPAQQGSKNSY